MLNRLSLRRFCAQNVAQDDSFHVPKDGVCGSPSEGVIIRVYFQLPQNRKVPRFRNGEELQRRHTHQKLGNEILHTTHGYKSVKGLILALNHPQLTPKWCQNVDEDGSCHGTKHGVRRDYWELHQNLSKVL